MKKLTIFLATTLAAGLVHTALGQLSAADQVTETMMQAQVCDASLLYMQYPFTSLSFAYSADPVGTTFSYSLTPGQTIDGASVVGSCSGSGDYTTGLYSWGSLFSVGATEFDGSYNMAWVTDSDDTGNLTGYLTSPAIDNTRWSVEGTVNADPKTGKDSGNVTVQKQIYSKQNNTWSDSGPAAVVPVSSTLSPPQSGAPPGWVFFNCKATVPVNQDLSVGGSGNVGVFIVPEPSPFWILLAGSAGVASLLKARRSAISRQRQ